MVAGMGLLGGCEARVPCRAGPAGRRAGDGGRGAALHALPLIRAPLRCGWLPRGRHPPCHARCGTAGVFVGYKRYDRRKKHIRELDERAEQILAATAAGGGAPSGAESEGGPGRGRGAGAGWWVGFL